MANVLGPRDPERARRTVGAVLYALGMAAGLALLVFVFVLPALLSPHASIHFQTMTLGALFALPPLLIYLWVPWIVDRYDPEPVWALMLALSWGAIAACGFSALINTIVGGVATAVGGPAFGNFVGACISAPVVEEAFKGMAVFGMFFFVRRQFDGVVDGIIYAAFAALGFAAVENIIYYSNAAQAEMLHNQSGVFVGTFVVRGILAPWGHPLYTAMTGLGFGLSREAEKGAVKWGGPILGYLGAVFLHSVWNTAATLSNALVLLMLPLWFVFVGTFFGIVVWMVRRKGRIIVDHLRDEVLMGNLTPWELELIGSPVAHMKASSSYGGKAGKAFVDAAARLALSKWHTARATRGRKLTISSDMVAPLRQELHRLRADVSRAMGFQVPQPQPWTPGVQQGPAHAWAPRRH